MAMAEKCSGTTAGSITAVAKAEAVEETLCTPRALLPKTARETRWRSGEGSEDTQRDAGWWRSCDDMGGCRCAGGNEESTTASQDRDRFIANGHPALRKK